MLAVQGEGEPIDLHMVEIMEMTHRTDTETRSALTTLFPAAPSFLPPLFLTSLLSSLPFLQIGEGSGSRPRSKAP